MHTNRKVMIMGIFRITQSTLQGIMLTEPHLQ
jgi:hypothetical protein